VLVNEMAVNCFDENCKIDTRKLKNLEKFLENCESFKNEPYCFISQRKLMPLQMHVVCKQLLYEKNKSMDKLEYANSITIWKNGNAILETMSEERETPLKPA
jgi:fructose-1,6-bisphosphatase